MIATFTFTIDLRCVLLWYVSVQVRTYCQTSNISRNVVRNKIVDHSDVVEASSVGATPTVSSFSTQHMVSMDWAYTTARRDETHLSLGIWCAF